MSMETKKEIKHLEKNIDKLEEAIGKLTE